jgi:hypothetical protein
MAYRTRSIEFRDFSNKPDSEPEKGSKGRFWHMSSEPTDVYKAIARYLRRHVVPRSDYWVWQFKKCITPEAIAVLLRSNSLARLAFIELIWARTVEPTVDIRRWDKRKQFTSTNWYVCRFSEVLGEATAGFEQYLQGHLKAGYLSWVRNHVFGLYCLAIWKEAERFVENGIRKKRCVWSTDEIPQVNLFQITVTRPSEQSLELTSYVDEPLALSRKVGRSKSQRILDYDNFIRVMRQKCVDGLCLTWSERDGWHTAPGIGFIDQWKIHHVSIAPRRRLKALLVYTGGYFYLRLFEYKIQVFSIRTSDLFTFMRQRFAEFCKLNNISKPIGEVYPSQQSMDDASQANQDFDHYSYFCELAINGHGFCKADRHIEMYGLGRLLHR